jgi:hypothetical protein
MKKCMLIIVFYIFSFSNSNALDNVLFLLESKSDLEVKIYNNFNKLYRGNNAWILKSELTNEILYKYTGTVEISTDKNGSIIFMAKNVGRSIGSVNGVTSNSNINKEAMNNIIALNKCLDLLSLFDNEYYEVML